MAFDALGQLAPEWLVLAGACLALIAGVSRWAQRLGIVPWVAFFALAAALVASVRQGVPVGDPTIPGLWLTSLTYYTRLIALSIGLLIVLVNWHQPVATERGEYMAMILFSLLGVLLTASANNLVVLFLAIELVSVPTYVLIALSREDARASESAVKYFFLGAMAAAILALGIAYLYGASGTTSLYSFTTGSAVSNFAFGSNMGAHALIGFVLVFIGLAFKVAAVPLHVYVADVYEGAASPVAGLLGFVPKFAGFIALIKLFGAFHWDFPPAVYWMIWVVAAATMTAGNVLALLQKNVKRMLAYSSVAHTGYMLVALLIGPVAGKGPMHDGVAALLFYMAVYGVMNLGAFAVLSSLRNGDHDVETLSGLSGLSRRAPFHALALAICAFSLMGFPPTVGFLGKLYIFSSAFSLGTSHPFWKPVLVLAVIGVINSAIGAAYYLRIIAAAYLQEEVEQVRVVSRTPLRLGLAYCALPMLFLFAWPGVLVREARKATVMLRESVPRVRTRVTANVPPAEAEKVSQGDRQH